MDPSFSRFDTKLALSLVLLGITVVIPNQHGVDAFTEPLIEAWIFPIQAHTHYGTWAVDAVSCHIDRAHVTTDHVVHDGRFYSQKSPGMTWLGTLPYGALTWANGGEMPALTITAKYLATVVVTPLLFLVFFAWGRWLRPRIGERWALVSVVVALGASPLYAYAGMFVDYSVGTALVLACFMLIERGAKGPTLASGAVAGLGLLVNYWVGALCVFVIAQKIFRLALASGALAAPIASLAVLGAVTAAAHLLFGAGAMAAMATVVGAALVVLPGLTLRERTWWSGAASLATAGFAIGFGALLLYDLLMWGDPFTQSYDKLLPHARALHDRMTLSWATLEESLIGWRRGLFMHVWWSPMALVALGLAAWKVARWRVVAAVGLALTALSYLFQAYYTSTNDDVLLFSRHMVPVWPWLAVGVALALRWLSAQESKAVRGLGAGLVTGLVCLGSLWPFIASWTYPLQTGFPPNQFMNIWMELFISGDHAPVTHWAQLFDRHDVPGMAGWREVQAAGGNWAPILLCAAAVMGAFALAFTHTTAERHDEAGSP